MRTTPIILRDQRGQPLVVLPPGCQFVPTELELVKHYLRPKVAGVESSFPGFILEKDLYGCNAEEPSQILAKTTDKELYLFTKLKKKFGHGRYIDRVAGKGSWVIQHNDKPIFDDEDTNTKIGSMKTFKFVLYADKKSKGKSNNINSSKEEISWLMEEYTLTSSQYCDPQEEWAICRIYKKVAADSSGGTRVVPLFIRSKKKMINIILRNKNGQPFVVPPGFRFLPTDKELIKHYLQPKVAGIVESSFPRFIKEKNLYGCNAEEPSQIFARTTDEELYVFTLLKKKFGHGNGNYIDRVAGKGSWVIQHNSNPIYDEDTKIKIGSMKTFKFVLDADKKSKGMINNSSNKKISWLMQEYTLTSSQCCDLQEEWALCRIYMKVAADSGGTKRGRQSWLSRQDIDPESDMPEMKRAKTLCGFSLPPNNAPTTTSDMIFTQKDHDQYLPPSDHPQPSTYYCGSGTGSTTPVSVSAPFSTMGMTSVHPLLLDDDDEPNNGGENRGPLSKEDDVQYYIEDDVGMLSDDYSSQFIDQALPAAQGSPAGLSDLQYVDNNGLVSTVENDLGPLREEMSSDLHPPLNLDKLIQDLLAIMEQHNIQVSDLLE